MRLRKPATGDKQATRYPAYEKSLRLLARREYSRNELRTRLLHDGYQREETDAALERLAAEHYQSDQRFIEMLVRSRIGQGYGPRRIQAELHMHAIDDARIQAQLDAVGVDWRRCAHEQLQRRFGDAPATEYAERARRAQFLLRRGFDAATVHDVLPDSA